MHTRAAPLRPPPGRVRAARRAALPLLLALACACALPHARARPFTPELPAGGDGDPADDSVAAHVAAHAAAARARGSSFWKADIVVVVTWHAGDLEWLAELDLRHVRARNPCRVQPGRSAL
jgi:hypothetical protein